MTCDVYYKQVRLRHGPVMALVVSNPEPTNALSPYHDSGLGFCGTP